MQEDPEERSKFVLHSFRHPLATYFNRDKGTYIRIKRQIINNKLTIMRNYVLSASNIVQQCLVLTVRTRHRFGGQITRISVPWGSIVNKLAVYILASAVGFGSSTYESVSFAQETDTGGSRALEEIVVSARKRDENITDVPGSVSLFSEQRIEQSNFREVGDLQHSIPNFIKTGPDNGNVQISMRGITSPTVTSGYSLPIGMFIDGVDQGSASYTFNQELIDVERVEIIRGPQGTIYGKNTIAGAFNIVTKKPTETFEGFASVEAGNYSLANIKAGVSGPIAGDSVLGRVAIFSRTRDGYVENVGTGGAVNDADNFGGRGTLRFVGDDNLTVDLSLDYQKSDRTMAYHEIIADTPGGIDYSVPGYIPPGLLTINHSYDDSDVTEIYGGSVTISKELDALSLTSITAFRHGETAMIEDTDHTPLDDQTFSHSKSINQFTQEFRIASEAADGENVNFDYMLGMYLLSADSDESMGYFFGEDSGLIPEQNDTNGGVATTQVAVFANANWYFTPKLALNAGIRFSDEQKEMNYIEEGFPVNGITEPIPYFTDSLSDSGWEPTVTLTYAISDNSNVYGKYTRGFKSGAFDLVIFKTPDRIGDFGFGPESVDSFEVGIKGLLFDGSFLYSIAAFSMDYEDLQIEILTPPAGPGLPPVRNKGSASADISGVEVELTYSPVDWFVLSAGYGATDAKFKDDVDVLGGNILQNTPDSTGYVDAALNFETSFGTVDARLGWTYKDDWFSFSSNNDFEKPEGYELLNARVGAHFESMGLDVALWGKNLTDEEYCTELWDIIGGMRCGFHEPLTYGIEIVKKF